MTEKKSAIPPDPEELQTLFLRACTLQEEGKLRDALLIYENLLTSIPQSSLLHFNCGLAYFELNDFLKAESHYRQAVTTAPDDPDIHYNRGLNFRRLLEFEDAAVSFKKAYEHGDTSVETLYNLALSRQDSEEYSEAARIYTIILSQDPSHQSTLNNFAYLCHKSGELKQAESLYTKLLKLNPEHLAAQHMLSSLKGITPDNAPLEYVESVFDNYADTFEDSLLANLHYNTPRVLYDLYRSLSHEDSRGTCLDLGCGTGLAGEQFRPCCNSLVGVDISQKMLDIAREKNLYNQLIKGDLNCFLQTQKQQYNLIVAADVFTYLGNLEAVFQACFTAVNNSGLLLFSVETVDKDHNNIPSDCNKNYILKQTGRFGHSAEYIRTLCKETRWTILGHKISRLRQDKGEWIKGHLFVLQKR